jgi:hypothetical protein
MSTISQKLAQWFHVRNPCVFDDIVVECQTHLAQSIRDTLMPVHPNRTITCDPPIAIPDPREPQKHYVLTHLYWHEWDHGWGFLIDMVIPEEETQGVPTASAFVDIFLHWKQRALVLEVSGYCEVCGVRRVATNPKWEIYFWAALFLNQRRKKQMVLISLLDQRFRHFDLFDSRLLVNEILPFLVS